MKCLIMSCVIFCAAQNVTGVRKRGRGGGMQRKQWVREGANERVEVWMKKGEKENRHREQALITDAALQRVQLFALLKPAA